MADSFPVRSPQLQTTTLGRLPGFQPVDLFARPLLAEHQQDPAIGQDGVTLEDRGRLGQLLPPLLGRQGLGRKWGDGRTNNVPEDDSRGWFGSRRRIRHAQAWVISRRERTIALRVRLPRMHRSSIWTGLLVGVTRITGGFSDKI